ncbi:RNA recognition motif domain-containing protein [Mucilaginibacter ginsenosidivorax]|uniref:RNA-binding protein n=1 Tax=Mucilaginibacter ginsenosidivorax TaxID=862126 RepID=A0A5B8W6S8_9SPHI|nr:RNA-binding protein [Mucilaginibacter ginsenosidivorax]QEC79574.1 RNA-binding protein [Mucilaginibacter ginsenosidivorax]
MVKLFVGGFPLDMTELDLVKIINLHGEVSTIKIVRDKKTRICKGYAFLEMKDREGAENAVIALDGTPMGDRTLNVKINEENAVKPPPPKRSFGGYNSNNNRSGSSYGSSSNYKRPVAGDAPKAKRPRRAT